MIALATVTMAQPAQARSGMLECHGGRHVPHGLGSVATLDCLFRSPGRLPRRYIATVTRVGLDIGFVEQVRLAWIVTASPLAERDGPIAGVYRGVGAHASLGVGFGGNILVGDRGNPFALQPVSVSGHTGLNLAAGIADFELKPVLVSRGGARIERP